MILFVFVFSPDLHGGQKRDMTGRQKDTDNDSGVGVSTTEKRFAYRYDVIHDSETAVHTVFCQTMS